MIEFRKSLPAFKEKERLLQAIARNQVCACDHFQLSIFNHTTLLLRDVLVFTFLFTEVSDFHFFAFVWLDLLYTSDQLYGDDFLHFSRLS